MKRWITRGTLGLILISVAAFGFAYHEGNLKARTLACSVVPFGTCKAYLERRAENMTEVHASDLMAFGSVPEMVDHLHAISGFDRLAMVPLWQNARQTQSIRARFDPDYKAKSLSRWLLALTQRGQFDETIEVAARHIAGNGSAPHTSGQFNSRIFVALAYMLRNGSTNCIEKSPAELCSLPLPMSQDLAEIADLQKAYEQLLPVFTQSRPDSIHKSIAHYLMHLIKMRAGDNVPPLPGGDQAFHQAFAPKLSFPKFQDVADGLGISRVTNAGTAIFEDFDGDGVLDAVISSRQEGENIAFYHNTGKGFEDRSAASGLGETQGAIIIKQVDFDNDGDVDLYIPRGDWGPETIDYPVSLMENDGSGIFKDTTTNHGLSVFGRAQGNDWADYDRDGDLDLIVSYEFNPDRGLSLHRNDGPDGFRQIALPQPYGQPGEDRVKTVIWGDFNNDGWEDIYTSAFSGERYLLRNRGTDAQGTHAGFEILRDALPPTVSEELSKRFVNYAAWVWDLNNDGWLDIAQLSLNNPPNRMQLALNNHYTPEAGVPTAALFMNQGGTGFKDAALEMGLLQSLPAMGANFGDINADGWLDFYVGTGNVPQFMLNPNMMFVNDAGRRFRDVTIEGGFGNIQKGHGSSFADFDQDGDIDILSQFGGEFPADRGRAALYQNPGHDNQIVILRLRGKSANSFGVGARIRVVVDAADGRERVIHTRVGTGATFGSNPLQVHVGVEQADQIRRIEVDWPSSTGRQVIDGPIAPAFIYELHENAPSLRKVAPL